MRLTFSSSFLVVLLAVVLLVATGGAHAKASAPDQYQEIILNTVKDVTKDFKTYIVSFREDASTATLDDMMKKVAEVGGRVVNQFSIIPAMVVEIPTELVTILSAIPGIESIEEDQPMHALDNN
ncbi:hypothetical protein DFJ77DRAFT_473154 [Powellomyces hirtus]|nr:hypothetical protein DFJ77DRAFT_473154 [Powellomyces hirtus]